MSMPDYFVRVTKGIANACSVLMHSILISFPIFKYFECGANLQLGNCSLNNFRIRTSLRFVCFPDVNSRAMML